ncbi:transcription factor Tfb4 [Irpex rosettiformis]|uniref:Transcription factor Tfb4 n=1 Tax=Irpex rosettiformis TaxID=378272 RepID=A0ACB8UGH3_9APHY|nr:transcription factor Tfb4 [Irpex rosettiformis]
MDKASHLSVILDLSPTQWQLSAQSNVSHPLTLSTFVSHLLAFLNAHMACKDDNSLAVFGALPGKSVMLYSTTTPMDEKAVAADANTYRPFKILDTTITQTILDQIESISDNDVEAPIDIVGALTKSLCYINRVTNPANSRSEDATLLPDPRILIVSVSPDQSSSYISVMNSIFSAQKLKVTIDVCKLHVADSVFLQQAAHLTGGSYISIERPDALLQFLMMSFLPPPSIRQLISVPTQDKIDFRAACFCHKNIVDIGFVCSVCLSIFCQPVPVCSTCQTKFPMKTLLRLKAAHPHTPPPGTPPLRSGTPANSLPRSTSIAPGGTPRQVSNGNPNMLPVARSNTSATR